MSSNTHFRKFNRPRLRAAAKAPMLAIVASTVLFSGCGPSVLDFRNAQIVNGKIYKGGADTGFTGKVTNVPEHVLLDRREGYWPFRDTWRSVMVGTRYSQLMTVTPSICDVELDEGLLDGDVTCHRTQSTILKYEMRFKNGALDGPFKVYDLSDNNVVTVGDFDNGILDGKQEVFGLQSHNVIYRVRWKQGIAEDKGERFDDR